MTKLSKIIFALGTVGLGIGACSKEQKMVNLLDDGTWELTSLKHNGVDVDISGGTCTLVFEYCKHNSSYCEGTYSATDSLGALVNGSFNYRIDKATTDGEKDTINLTDQAGPLFASNYLVTNENFAMESLTEASLKLTNDEWGVAVERTFTKQ